MSSQNKKLNDYEEIAKIESEGINMLLSKSEVIGLAYLNDAIKSFVSLLKEEKGNMIPSMDIDYRTFIFNIIENIKPEYKDIVTAEILLPKYNINMDILVSALRKDT